MKLHHALRMTVLFTPTIKAFRVDFFANSNCAGENIGEWIGGEPQGCQTFFVGDASGAVVYSTGSVDDNSTVVFYSSNDCNDKTAVAQADNSCISVSSFAADYKSFNVIPIYNDFKKSKRDVTESQPSGPYNYTHGVVAPYAGTMYKWHQVADGIYRGINPLVWDDSVNVQNTTQLNVTVPEATKRDITLTGREISLREPAALFERSFLYATCETATICMLHAIAPTLSGPVDTYFTIASAGEYFLNQVFQLGGAQIWGYLNSPVVSSIVLPTVLLEFNAAYTSGAMSGITTNKVQASKCSNTQTDKDAMLSLMNDFAAANPQRAFSVEVSFGGVQGTFSVEAIPDGQRGDGDTCGAPPTDPTTQRRAIGWQA